MTPAAYDRLRALARTLASGEDPAELVHDTWAASDGAAPQSRGWWRVALRRRRAMQLRSEMRRAAREAASLPPGRLPEPATAAEQNQVAAALTGALDDLPPEDRMLVLARICEGRSAVELASELGMPASTVRTRISRGLARMRQSLDGRYGNRAAWTAAFVALPSIAPATAKGAGASVAVGAAMGMTKTTLFAVGGLALGVITWMFLADGTQQPAPAAAAAAASPEPVGDRAQVADPGTDEPAEPESHKARWTRMHREIVAAQHARGAAERTPAPAVDVDPDEVEAEVARMLASLEGFGQLAPGLITAFEQLAPLLAECLQHLPDDATGKLHMRAQLIAEPDVGGLVESLEVVDNTIDSPEFSECLRETTYSLTLDDIDESLSESLNISVDMEERTLNVGTELDLDNLLQLAKQHPGTFETLLADADTRENFVELLSNEQFTKDNPEFAQAVRDALAKPEG